MVTLQRVSSQAADLADEKANQERGTKQLMELIQCVRGDPMGPLRQPPPAPAEVVTKHGDGCRCMQCQGHPLNCKCTACAPVSAPAHVPQSMALGQGPSPWMHHQPAASGAMPWGNGVPAAPWGYAGPPPRHGHLQLLPPTPPASTQAPVTAASAATAVVPWGYGGHAPSSPPPSAPWAWAHMGWRQPAPAYGAQLAAPYYPPPGGPDPHQPAPH
jgi:hypothetical protein